MGLRTFNILSVKYIELLSISPTPKRIAAQLTTGLLVQILKAMFDVAAPYDKAFRNRGSLLILCRSLVARVSVTVTSSLIMINAAGPWGSNRNSTRRL